MAGLYLDRGARAFRIGIVSIDKGELVGKLDHPAAFGFITFSADGRALTYGDVKAGVGNIWVQPIDGGPAQPVTNFASGWIFGFALSHDGRQLAVARGTVTSDVVLVSNLAVSAR